MAGQKIAASYEPALSPVLIDPCVNRSRQPALPAVARGRDFERRFDHLTLFNDIFWEAQGETILAIGPHVPAHLDPERDIAFHDLESGARLEARYLPSRLQLHGDMYRITPGDRTRALLVRFGGQSVAVAVQPNLSHRLAGRRVLATRCQNDAITWMTDWARFHAREYGFDAIVHYDNRSTAYAVEDARCALASVPGIEVAVVLSWPFPMEPPHALVPRTGRIFWHRQMKDRWAESCRLEHQRRRFLARAELVFVADVDELLVRRSPGAELDGLFVNPETAWARFDSEIVVNVADLPERLPRHRDFHWIWDNQTFKTPKYVVKPDRCPDGARWWLHDVAWAPGVDVPPSDFSVAHFFALTTGWGGKDTRALKHTPTPDAYHEDHVLRAALDRVFDSESVAIDFAASAAPENPSLLRKNAYELARAGDRHAALKSITRAIARDPNHPAQYVLRQALFAEQGSDGSVNQPPRS